MMLTQLIPLLRCIPKLFLACLREEILLLLQKNGPTLIILAFCSSCAAQSNSPERILAQCANAMNSQKAARSLVAEGQVSSAAEDNGNGQLTIKTSAKNQFHQEETFASGVQVSNINGAEGYWSHNGQKKAADNHTISYFQPDHIPALACLPDFASRGLQAEYVATESLNGHQIYHVKLTATPKGKSARIDAANGLLSERHVFIDTDSYTVSAVRYWIFSPNALENRSAWEAVYSDYRQVDGVLMPFHMENRVDGMKFRDVTFTNFHTDVPVTDDDFR